eukprot:350655-Chlamydomonas_euryale.AAC.5
MRCNDVHSSPGTFWCLLCTLVLATRHPPHPVQPQSASMVEQKFSMSPYRMTAPLRLPNHAVPILPIAIPTHSHSAAAQTTTPPPAPPPLTLTRPHPALQRRRPLHPHLPLPLSPSLAPTPLCSGIEHFTYSLPERAAQTTATALFAGLYAAAFAALYSWVPGVAAAALFSWLAHRLSASKCALLLVLGATGKLWIFWVGAGQRQGRLQGRCGCRGDMGAGEVWMLRRCGCCGGVGAGEVRVSWRFGCCGGVGAVEVWVLWRYGRCGGVGAGEVWVLQRCGCCRGVGAVKVWVLGRCGCRVSVGAG